MKSTRTNDSTESPTQLSNETQSDQSTQKRSGSRAGHQKLPRERRPLTLMLRLLQLHTTLPQPEPNWESNHEQIQTTRQRWHPMVREQAPSDDVIVRRGNKEIVVTSPTHHDHYTRWTSLSYREIGPQESRPPDTTPQEKEPPDRPAIARVIDPDSYHRWSQDRIAYLIGVKERREAPGRWREQLPDKNGAHALKERKTTKLDYARATTTSCARHHESSPEFRRPTPKNLHAPAGDHQQKEGDNKLQIGTRYTTTRRSAPIKA